MDNAINSDSSYKRISTEKYYSVEIMLINRAVQRNLKIQYGRCVLTGISCFNDYIVEDYSITRGLLPLPELRRKDSNMVIGLELLFNCKYNLL